MVAEPECAAAEDVVDSVAVAVEAAEADVVDSEVDNGVEHPALLRSDQMEILDDSFGARTACEDIIHASADRFKTHRYVCAVGRHSGVKGGSVYGATEEDGMSVKDNPVSAQNFLATMCEALKLDPRKQNTPRFHYPQTARAAVGVDQVGTNEAPQTSAQQSAE